MSARDSKARQAWVEKLIACWKPRLLLSHWAVTVVMMAKDKLDADGDDLLAEILVSSRYTESTLYIYPKLFSFSVAQRKATIVHELTHMLVNPVRTQLYKMVKAKMLDSGVEEDLSEGLTEHISKIAFTAYSKDRRGYRL